MTLIGSVPRRCVNLPPGAFGALVGCTLRGRLSQGPELERFQGELAAWLGVPHAFGAETGRSAFQLALEALDLPQGAEIVFPAFTFPVMPMVAKLLGYVPVFANVDPATFNSGPEEVEAVLSERTGAVLATHLFGLPCPIEGLAELTRARGLRLMEDCAHAIGVRVGGRQVGTFGDIGIYSFAEGKNMPCFGGGAIATADDRIALRVRELLAACPPPDPGRLRRKAISVWIKWLVTRPTVFGLTVFPVLRLKQILGRPLMDSAVGDELLTEFRASRPRVTPMGNVQAALGRIQLRHIDAFNAGARANGEVLTEALGDVRGLRVPAAEGEHIYVYYPLEVAPELRDGLRHHLLRHGIDAKLSDMSDCGALATFRDEAGGRRGGGDAPLEASVLEICVYPSISKARIRRVARALRSWSAAPRGQQPERAAASSESTA